MRRQLYIHMVFLFCILPALSFAQNNIRTTTTNAPGYRTVTFEPPAGKISINLPDDMAAGDMISGTVVMDPNGIDKEKAKNQKILSSFGVQAGGKVITNNFTLELVEGARKLSEESQLVIQLLNSSGNVMGQTQIPIMEKPALSVQPGIRTDLNVILQGDRIPVYSNATFPAKVSFSAIDGTGKINDLGQLCASPRTVVLLSPQSLNTGTITLQQNNSDNTTQFFLGDLELVIPNTNLRSGQQTYAEVTVPFDPKRQQVNAMQIPKFSITLQNLHPTVVNMDGGNTQWVSFPLNENIADKNAWQLRRSITGVKPGSFSVSATLLADHNISNDPFQPQLDLIKTPEDFNKWVNALKKDLAYYGELHKMGDEGLSANMQRAILNMPRANNMHPINDFKTVAIVLLRPLHIPKGVAMTWLSMYESAKNIYQSVNTTTPVLSPLQKQILYNAAVLSGIIANRSKDPALQDLSVKVIQRTNQEQTGNTMMPELMNSLTEMFQRTDTRLGDEPYKVYKYEMQDMMVTSRLMEQEGMYYYLPAPGIFFSFKQNPGSYGFREDDPCENKGPITWTWHQTFPCKIELKIVDYGNTPGEQEFVDYIIEQLTKLSEKGGDIGSKMGKAFSFKGRAFSMFARCYREWENWDITYICVGGRWKLQSMVPGKPPKGRDNLSGWISLLNAGGNNEWFKTDDAKWVDDAIAKAVFCCP